MASTAAATASASASLPHRTVSSIRAGAGGGGGGGSGGGSQAIPTTPHTPSRPIPSIAFGSPSSLRAEDDLIVIELGSRKLRVGFAGDSAPKRIVSFGPEQQRRVGDFRTWAPGYQSDWRARSVGRSWTSDHELWQLDVRGQDLGLVGDKLERELREAFTKYLLLDSKQRRMSLVLPPTIPIPLLSSVLDTIFHRFHAPSIALLSSPVMAALAAGTRSALVVDLGWHETTVTGVYEYREVHSWRTVRSGKMLMNETYNLLADAIEGEQSREQPREETSRGTISFEECEEVATRLLWCKRNSKGQNQEVTEGLPTLHEQDESDESSESVEQVDPTEDTSPVAVNLSSCSPPKTLQIPFSQLAEPCEATFFENRFAPSCFDDHELPVPLLVYRALLQLPMDVRAICMSRIIFTGGCSSIIGLKGRIFDEVSLLAQERGWDPVVGKGVEQYRTNPKLNRGKSRQTADESNPPIVVEPSESGPAPGPRADDGSPTSYTADVQQKEDQVEAQIRKERNYEPSMQGTLRAIDSLGPWCGASMTAQLKVPALAMVDRELWLQHGVAGASRPNDIDVKAQSRQSMGAGGLIRGQGAQPSNWTLGVWGAI